MIWLLSILWQGWNSHDRRLLALIMKASCPASSPNEQPLQKTLWEGFYPRQLARPASKRAGNRLHDGSFRDIKESLRAFMKRNRKKWIKPAAKYVPIFFECTCYAAAV